MTFFNPIAGALQQSDQVQQQMSDKARQIRRARAMRSNSAMISGQLDHQVESLNEVVEINRDAPSREETSKKRKPPQQQAPDNPDAPQVRLDLTA